MDRDHICKEKIREHDLDFYEAIITHVPFMPDLRPKETMKRMKSEPQLNWCVIYSELEAMAYDEDSLAFIQMINDELTRKIDYYAYERPDITENFFALYPALTWLLLRIGNKRIMNPLFVSQGLYLDQFIIHVDDIQYIKDEGTAEKILKRYPWLKPSSASPKWSSRGQIILDYVQYPKEFLHLRNEYLRNAIINRHPIYFSFVFSKVKDYLSSSDLLSLYSSMIGRWIREEKKMRLIIFHDKFPNPHRFEIVADLMSQGYNRIVISLLDQDKEDIPNKEKLLLYANNELLLILLQDERFDKIDKQTLHDILVDAIEKPQNADERLERLRILLDDGRFFEYNVAQQVARRYVDRLDILDVFLSYPQIDIDDIFFFSSARAVSDITLIHILSSPRFNPNIIDHPRVRPMERNRIADLIRRENLPFIVKKMKQYPYKVIITRR